MVDQAENARAISALCEAGNITLDVFIDLNVGMNRTGVLPERAEALVDAILPLKSLQIIGLHGYDGHIHDAELSVRCQGADAAYALTERVFREISASLLSIGKGDGRYSYIPDVREAEGLRMQSRHVCVLGLGVWNAYPDMPFKVAALLITRVISVLDEHHVCVDLGYKAVARKVLCPVCFS